MSTTQEAIANSIINPTTTLTGSISNVDTSIPVVAPTSPDVWPTNGRFVIKIENELLRVTAATSSATTLTAVERGSEGTTAGSHTSGTNVDLVVSKASLNRYLRQQFSTLSFRLAR